MGSNFTDLTMPGEKFRSRGLTILYDEISEISPIFTYSIFFLHFLTTGVFDYKVQVLLDPKIPKNSETNFVR